MAVKEVDLYVSHIQDDLNDGLTWFKKDDLGYGSIQEKYNAKEIQIMTIRKHPSLKDLETTLTMFNIIDDTRKEKPNDDIEHDNSVTNNIIEEQETFLVTELTPVENTNTEQDSFSAFTNL